MNTRQIILQSRPLGTPHCKILKLKTPLEEISLGRCYLRAILFSRSLHARPMNDAKSYVAPFKINEP
jgi:hypothetical protein